MPETRKHLISRSTLRKFLLWLLAVAAVVSLTSPGRRFWKSAFRLSGFDAGTDAPLSIHMLDVGKADAILIQCEGHTALVDAGTYLSGETVVDYMARCQMGPLEYAIVSHPDKDHLGGMPQVLSEAGAETFVRSEYFPEEYGEVNAVLREKDIPCQIVSQGDALSLGGAVLRFLGPVREYEDANDSSLVFRLEYEGFTALFCGDIEKAAEKDLVNSGADLSADLLKVPHHGSKTSCSKRFVKAVSPRYALIPVGPDSNELPDEETLRRLSDAGAEIYRTDIDGAIVFSVEDGACHIKTEA